MFIKCNMCDGADSLLIHLTTNDRYEIRYRYEEGLYLILTDKEIELREVDLYCQGRPGLPEYAVGDMYCELLEQIIKQIADVSEAETVIDIDEIECKLLTEKYEKEWQKNGYIDIDATGSW